MKNNEDSTKDSNFKKMTKYETIISNIDPELLKKWENEQNFLKSQLIEKDEFSFSINDISESIRIAGMDISASKSDPETAVVGLVVCDSKDNYNILYEKFEFVKITQPYVPGFLAFREVDHLLKLLEDLKNSRPELMPQIILIDGNGILHSNRFGLACHLGVLSGITTIGCAKTVFSVDGINKKTVRDAANNLTKAGEFLYLKGISGQIWAAALKCTEQSIDPIIVNIGHKISLDTAIQIVKKTCNYRVPEPIRLADKRSRVIIREYDSRGAVFDINTLKLNYN
jgi:deoxyinosine 3'endonuclease (endonuclease V)